ncbi:hypothetical protein ElyMa_004961600 [Elysia marginata]|uniref:Uncharacterized protein n=1 Tax=Elysia marginata TaxID=1093978 RepID=A0AAV4J4S5_9GAST|nr:hypothetical protein ElyMa_004961600 [Elysia marginata]
MTTFDLDISKGNSALKFQPISVLSSPRTTSGGCSSALESALRERWKISRRLGRTKNCLRAFAQRASNDGGDFSLIVMRRFDVVLGLFFVVNVRSPVHITLSEKVQKCHQHNRIILRTC